MKRELAIVILGLIFQAGISQKVINRDFKPHFDKYGVDGCFVLYNSTDDEYIRYNHSLCDSGYIPSSTFKIPHSIIAVEEELINDANEIIKWDGHKWPSQEWNQDQTLKTSIKFSCIWVFIGFAEQIGIEKYYEYVNSFDYGNKILTGPPTRFWLSGQFRISANEQVKFLKRFYYNELDVSTPSIDIVKDVIVLKQTENYRFSGKTGSGRINDKNYIIWLVGYLERDNKPYFYAMNFITDDYNKTRNARLEITEEILKELELLE